MNDIHITRGCFHVPAENSDDKTLRKAHFCCGKNKMDVCNWADGLPNDGSDHHLVEIRFKNTRKAYYVNHTGIPLAKGDIVAVEASPGHDIGVVSLTGLLVPFQMKNKKIPVSGLKKIYRKAKSVDIEKWFQAIEREPETMRIARQMANSLNITMKISDVEYQGDKTKVTFYYVSDDRVDFRQLIKNFAEHFRVRIEMKQIGSRQEAGKVGGIGTCGRELCCSKWMSSFASVTTSAARYQDMALNPQKLAGQCGKLKCCLNFELRHYIEAQKNFPDTSIPIETEQGKAYHFKTDIFRRIIWYSIGSDKDKDNDNVKYIPLDADVVTELLRQNRKGIKVKELLANEDVQSLQKTDISYLNAAGEDSISRFEERRKKRKKKEKKPQQGRPSSPKTTPENEKGKNHRSSGETASSNTHRRRDRPKNQNEK
ncbi:MAG: hypothetical protein LBS03_10890 [Bacteroidales bacterium]|jgi:cell fate regulator YaaT (PSP1 superfamily)|nr:hypothetical protein [Bacteroidales bacterium]